MLAALVGDPSSEVRWRAALVLMSAGDATLIGDLEEALTLEEDEQVREMIQDAIGKLRD